MTNIFKSFVILFLTTTVSGCVSSDSMNIAKAKWLCKDHGGLYDLNGFLAYPVECKNGKKYHGDELKAVLMPVEFAKEHLK